MSIYSFNYLVYITKKKKGKKHTYIHKSEIRLFHPSDCPPSPATARHPVLDFRVGKSCHG